MKRTWAIAKRVLKELFRDKRTLALMFLAPILILSLMKVVFTTNSTVDVNIATVNIQSSLVKQMNKMNNINVTKYSTEANANKALKDQKVDGVVHKKGGNFYVKNANTDASKTAATKAALQSSMVATNVKQLKEKLTKIAAANPQVAAAMQGNKQTAPKIHNSYVYGNKDTSFFDKILPILMGFFVFFFVFLISGMALLKERTTGTLDRLLATPVRRSEIVFGYMISYGLLAIVQTLIIVLFTVYVLNVEVLGNIWNMVLVNVVLAVVALALGILMSTFAKSEFQMMQFIPIIVIPQVFFSGIIPLDQMAHWVQDLAYILPLKYAGEATSAVVLNGYGLGHILAPIGALLIFLVILTMLNIYGLRRYRKV
ncbi:ABC transporter permease [Companilactobacillus ginsenosidimutans]|uniref:Antibiotic ABC transporter permease n=1 Tax=Companilactobacillus ginsenosidimutans TaxID=1007676 RepID=A0A0H4QM54_9LACO|nr:ABC transporter permease [Companilactobacillus ginsenosidimutans]AKP67793.1 antibiotic ABC transporter permease [Companilactobacillus ginsenosidimutans]